MSQLTIRRVWTQPYFFELKGSLSWGQGHKLAALQHVLVLVELSDGAIGMAEAPPRPTIYGETADSIHAIVTQEIAPHLVGQAVHEPADIVTLSQRLRLVRNNNTARGAVDIALYSALARSKGVHLADLLPVVQPTLDVSFILGTGDIDTVLKEVQWIHAQGVRVLKIKVGQDLQREAEQIGHIRAAYGDSLRLYADANQCYTAANVSDTLAQLRDLGLLWCEEPLPVTHLRARAALQAEGILPLIADDSTFTLPELEREIDFNAFDILNIKTARTGYSESGAMLALARAHQKGVMVGSQAGSMLGCLHALLFAAQAGISYPTEGTFFLKVKDHYPDLLTIADGVVTLADVRQALNYVEADLLQRIS